jgi:hypothetical protein
MFLTQFLAGRKQKRPSAYLLTLKQKSFKSLKDYIQRFNAERLTVVDAQENLVLATLINGISPQGNLVA